MKWPWTRLETRASYTSQILGLQYAGATGGGSAADAAATTAIERATVLYASAFSVATVKAPGRMSGSITPTWLAGVVRDLLRHGEHLSKITVVNGRVRLVPASLWNITGTADPATWTYDVQLSGPSAMTTERMPAAGVVHFMWSRSRSTPWIGCGPLTNCGLSARILGGLSRRLGDRAVQSTGSFLPVPRHDVDPDENTNKNTLLASDIDKASGRMLLVNTTAGGDGDRANAPQKDYNPNDFGLRIPEEASALMEQVEGRIFAATGIPPGLGGGTTSGQAVSNLYRQWIFGPVQGLAARLARELEDKLDVAPISFSFAGLGHVNVAERAAAVARLVDKAKVPLDQARLAVGL